MNLDPRLVKRSASAAGIKPNITSTDVAPKGQSNENGPSALEKLLVLEGDVRAVSSFNALGYFMCNETTKLVPAAQVLFFVAGARKGSWRLKAASSVTTIDRNAPMVRNAEKLVSDLNEPNKLQVVSDAKLKVLDLSFGHGLLLPLIAPSGPVLGRLLLLRNTEFSESEKVLSQRLSGAYGHALAYFDKSLRTARFSRNLKFCISACVVLGGLALMIPVPMSVLAPAEIVARDPYIVTAPMDGVIQSIDIEPNAPVRAGSIVMRFNDTELLGRLGVAERNLEVAEARYRRVLQGASSSAEMRRDIAVAKSELGVAEAERDEAKAAFERSVVYAPSDGVALFTSKDDWVGRPVATGEGVMEIGDPARVEMRIDVSIGDSIVLQEGASVRVFLHNDPLKPFNAQYERASFRAQETDQNTLSYRVTALPQISPEDQSDLRIGLRGTARISNGKVSLGYYLFRSPLSAARQWLGL
ncbi:MAG: HlyD family efflux transporter periplasmic adaptor subunit [Ahrensia sp.]|nr:HlyD family efflux transporter periplasmic adaptor subunit [Ahrensia sp.]